ncbi:MAG: hypothetical protein BWY68_00875 [bacterium ADurb.Bin400]|nr:MAG: hypothetical protein BWY68_00875 [bacterium ADurb.Bin400]
MDSQERKIRNAIALANLLDNRYKIAGIRFGLDPIIGLVPGLGDAVSFLLSVYIVSVAVQSGLPKNTTGQMLFNVIFDLLIGVVPLIGDLADLTYRANAKNAVLLEQYLLGLNKPR